MLSKEDNELLTRIGPGTACGDLMRRYWQPVAATVMLDENPVRPVKLLGESLTLYRDRQGRLGLIGQRCPHRAVDMQFGIPEQEGLRCPYHGWMFDGTGRCLEMPLEPAPSLTLPREGGEERVAFKDRISIKSYPVQELGGLVWAYLGPLPAPLLPRLDLFVKEGCFRQILATVIPCNWLQCMENRADIAHGTYLHGRFFQYVLERQGRPSDDPYHRSNASMRQPPVRHRVQLTKYGFVKQALMQGETEETSDSWNTGINPVFFPITLRLGNAGMMRQQIQIGVPLDDTHIWHVTYDCYVPPDGVTAPEQPSVAYVDVPLRDTNGELILDYVIAQDMVAWWSQGDITDRTEEHLGYSDMVITAYRKMLKQQIEIVRQGGEPMNVFRHPAENRVIEFDLAPPRGPVSVYRENYHKGGYAQDDLERYSPDLDVIKDLMQQAAELGKQATSRR